MTKTEIDVMWNRALREAIEGGEEFTRYRFAAMVASAEREAEREACAKVAGWLWQQFQDTKDAHERLSSAPFRPSRFGFDQSTVQQSKRMMDAIRARGQA
jgi:hypothetical protein